MVMSMAGILSKTATPDMEDLVQGLQVLYCITLGQTTTPEMEDLVQGLEVVSFSYIFFKRVGAGVPEAAIKWFTSIYLYKIWDSKNPYFL
jgi:hypothetical protein